MHHPSDRITHTTAFVTPVVDHWLEREIAQWVHPMKDRSDLQFKFYLQTIYCVEFRQWTTFMCCFKFWMIINFLLLLNSRSGASASANKVCGMCCHVCGMVYIKEPLLLIEPVVDWVTGHATGCVREWACPKRECIWTRIGMSIPGSGISGFPFLPYVWSLIICNNTL